MTLTYYKSLGKLIEFSNYLLRFIFILKKTILVGQSDQTILDILKNNLTPQFDVVLMTDGIEVFNWLYSHKKVDALVLDVFLPKLNGIEIVEQLKRSALFAGLPVVVLTDADSQLVREKCLESGAAAYITKPFDPVGFKELLQSILVPQRV